MRSDGNTTSDGIGIPGGVGGGSRHESHTIFYVGVHDVEVALQKAERLGGTRRMGPEQNPGTDLVVGHFTDPEGHLIGVASIPYPANKSGSGEHAGTPVH